MNIEEACKRYHWIQVAPDGVVEMFLDHHALQTFRSCEAAFELSMMANVKAKGKSWNLEFGIIWHYMVEEFYIAKRDGVFNINTWLPKAITAWTKAKMDEQFETHKMYKTLGGLSGLIAMCGQYAEHFAAEVDRLRVIGIEITFGKKKEVPLGEFEVPNYKLRQVLRLSYIDTTESTKVRCYLTGRMDFLMDSGSSIGPLDHKTTAFFRGDPTAAYNPQEGMTGYVYATKFILKDKFPELLEGRKVDRIWINFAQVTPNANAMERFKRIPIFKTDYQLEEYRLRQLRTFHKIYDMVILGERPDWNTAVCNNMFHSECQYRALHRQNTSDAMLQILQNDFVVAPAWDPEKVED